MSKEHRSLIDLLREASDLEIRLMENGGEISDDIALDLELHEVNLRSKIDAYAHVLNQIDMREAHALAKMKEWGEVVNTCDKARENLKARLSLALDALASNDIIGYEYTVKRQLNPPRVKVVDAEKIPGSYLITKTETTIDRRSVLDALKSGHSVPGAELERTTRIVVKTSKIEPKNNNKMMVVDNGGGVEQQGSIAARDGETARQLSAN